MNDGAVATGTSADDGRGGSRPDGSAVDSRWWYWIAVAPVVTLVEVVLGTVLLGFVFATAGGFDPTYLIIVGPYTLVALALRLLFVVAIFLDATAVRRANLGWDPRPRSLAVAGVFAVLVPLADLVVAVYYLRRRRAFVGTP